MDETYRCDIFELNERVKIEFETLLKSAPPRRNKNYQLTKLLQNETPERSSEGLGVKIIEFYALPYNLRTERNFARHFGIKPYPWLLEQFSLNLTTAYITETEMMKLATRFRHQFKNKLQSPEEITTVELLHIVIHRTTNPRWDEVNSGIDLLIFANRWQAVCHFLFGDRYNDFFCDLDKKLSEMNSNTLTLPVPTLNDGNANSSIDLSLTQTDLDWMSGVLSALESNRRLPLYPLSKGPRMPIPRRLEQLVRTSYRLFPKRHATLDTTIQRVSLQCLAIYQQTAKSNQR